VHAFVHACYRFRTRARRRRRGGRCVFVRRHTGLVGAALSRASAVRPAGTALAPARTDLTPRQGRFDRLADLTHLTHFVDMAGLHPPCSRALVHAGPGLAGASRPAQSQRRLQRGRAASSTRRWGIRGRARTTGRPPPQALSAGSGAARSECSCAARLTTWGRSSWPSTGRTRRGPFALHQPRQRQPGAWQLPRRSLHRQGRGTLTCTTSA
jgi:hypothetical protein